jgi:hypothetical protein
MINTYPSSQTSTGNEAMSALISGTDNDIIIGDEYLRFLKWRSSRLMSRRGDSLQLLQEGVYDLLVKAEESGAKLPFSGIIQGVENKTRGWRAAWVIDSQLS